MNTKNGKVLLTDLHTYLVGFYTYLTHFTKNKITNTYLLKANHMAQKAKQYFRLLKTVVFLNIDYKKNLLVKQLYLVLSKNWQQVKAMLINKKCMRHLQKHKALI